MPDTPEGRITLAILGEKIDEVNRQLSVCSYKIDKAMDTSQQNNVDIATLTEHQKNIEKDVRDLEVKSERWNIINSVLASIAAIAATIAAMLGLH